MPRNTKLAELDDVGNVILVHVTDRPLADVLEDEANEDRNLIAWDGDVPDEQAYTRRWDGKKWGAAAAGYVKTVEKERSAGLAELKRQA